MDCESYLDELRDELDRGGLDEDAEVRPEPPAARIVLRREPVGAPDAVRHEAGRQHRLHEGHRVKDSNERRELMAEDA